MMNLVIDSIINMAPYIIVHMGNGVIGGICMNFELRDGHEHLEETKQLFTEYVRSLGVGCDSKEFNDLGDKYKSERERLYIAYMDGKPAGCVAIRKIDAAHAEMKRLFVRPEFRRTGLGMSLAKIVVEEAKELGYKELLLDSLPSMESAVELYNALGFKKNVDKLSPQKVTTVVHLRLPLV